MSIAWEDLIPIDGYFSVTSNVHNETITTPLFANVKVKDAIVDRIKDKKGVRPNSGPDLNRAVIHLHWIEERAEIFLDTSGETLAKHGYRKHPGKAPMLEALASATIMATQWDGRSPFVNPMCGSGTLAIEAALMAQNRKPGLQRMNYSFMHFIGYNEEVFFEERRILKDITDKTNLPHIIASDISSEAVEIAILNARTAGVEHLIEFETCDFAETTVPEGAGVIMFNPEYGERLGVHTAFQDGRSFTNAPQRRLAACLCFFLSSMTLVTTTPHLGASWVGIEATTLSSAPLIYFHRHQRSLEATWKYLIICSVGIALAMVGNILLSVAFYTPEGMEAMVEGMDQVGWYVSHARAGEETWLKAAFIFLLVGYGTKMGLAPLHNWLPDAHSQAPSLVSALLSGALLNCAMLGILR